MVKATLPLSINKLLPFTNDLVIYLQYLIEMFVQLKLAAFKVLGECGVGFKFCYSGSGLSVTTGPMNSGTLEFGVNGIIRVTRRAHSTGMFSY